LYIYLSIRDKFHFFVESIYILQQLANEPGFVKLKNNYGSQALTDLFNLD